MYLCNVDHPSKILIFLATCIFFLLQIARSTSKQKSSSKSGKKRHHSKSDPHSGGSKASDHKTRRARNGANDDRTTAKSKRKRARSKLEKNKTDSQDQSQDYDGMEISIADGVLESGMENRINGNLEVTAIQLAGSIGGSGEESLDSAVLQRMSRAEERRREVERKRAEKRELERRKREEEERKLKLQVYSNYTTCINYVIFCTIYSSY